MLRDTLHDAFHRSETRAYRRTERAIYALVVISVALLIAETLVDEGEILRSLIAADRVVLALFAIELVLRVVTYRPPELRVFDRPPLGQLRVHLTARLRFLFTPLVLIDLITVLAVVPALRGLRALRLLRLLRWRSIFRYANPIEGLSAALRADKLLFGLGLTMLGGLTVLGGLSLYLVERGANPQVNSVADGMWWALVTLTTVGFGDISPVTALGRMLGAFLMVGGMFTLALFAGIVGHSLLNAVLSIREEQFRMSDYVQHIVVCGYEEGDTLLLEALESEIDTTVRPIVIFSPRARPTDVPPKFLWVQGDPTKESELDKVRLSHASTVIVSGERQVTPQLADAKTILTVFTLRAYMSKRPEEEVRKQPLYLVAEILDSENVAHARTAGADEVIETRRVGSSLLAHGVAFPGVADAAGRLVTNGAQNLYVGICPSGIGTFGDAREALQMEHRALLIGVIEPNSGVEKINPSPDFELSEADRLVYLAPAPVLEASCDS